MPNAEQAFVPTNKILRYLLDPANERNQGKAGFFFRFGFTRRSWRRLATALRQHALLYDVVSTETTEYGVKYRIVGALTTPDERNPTVRTLWIVQHGDDMPRFVTAVPHDRRRR